MDRLSWKCFLLMLAILWPSALWPSAAAGQTVTQGAAHTHKLAGFSAGVTVGAIVFSLDEVLGSSCTGSGSYLTVCRVGYVTAAAVGGGVGVLVGSVVKTDQPPGRATWALFGSALGTFGAFLASNAVCEQEDVSNPEYLCGYDGMVSSRAIASGALVGGVLGALLGGGSETLQVRSFGPARRHDGRIGVETAWRWVP